MTTSADDLEPWIIWGYYVSPMTYGQNAIAINEFLDERWSTVSPVYGLRTLVRTFFKLEFCTHHYLIVVRYTFSFVSTAQYRSKVC